MSQFNDSNASSRSTPAPKKRANPKKRLENDLEAKRTKKMSQSFIGWLEVKEKKTPRTLPPIDAMPHLRPFEIKDGMTLAPLLPRAALTPDECQSMMTVSAESSKYLPSVKDKKLVQSKRGQVATPLDGLCEMGLETGRVKLLQFHTNQRPAYYGTWHKRSAHISGRRPFSTGEKTIDYENDSDLEWEEDPPDAEECNSDDDKENEGEEEDGSNDDDDLDGWLVNDGYISEGEGEGDDSNGTAEDPEKRQARLEKMKAAAKAVRKEAKKRRQTRHLIPILYGPSWALPSKDEQEKNPVLNQLVAGVLFDYAGMLKS